MSDDAQDFDDGWYDLPDHPPCPKCDGAGVVDCYCGGDLCVCTNYGEKPCGLCYGDGEVSEERAAAYLKRKRELSQAFAEALKKSQASAEPAPAPQGEAGKESAAPLHGKG